MSNYNNLKNAIQSVIKANGNNEITGPILQTELLAMINTLGAGYQYMGVAQPSTNPGTPDARIMYLAYLPGTYVNFGGITVTGFCVLKYDTVWTKEDIPISGGGGGADFFTEPDDLTLETVGDDSKLLKFANRSYNTTTPNGYGYKILRSGDTLATEMNGLVNTVFSIRYDFDLGGGTLNLPANSILRFDGGSFRHGTLAGNTTVIDAPDYQIFGKAVNDPDYNSQKITFTGSWVGELNACWVGAKTTISNYDNGIVLNDWLNNYSSVFKKINFPRGTYYFLSESALTSDVRNLVLNGNNSLFNVNISATDAYFLKLQNSGSGSSGENFRIENVRIYNVKTTSGEQISRTRAILFDRAQRFEVHNVQIWYFDIAVALASVWYGGFTGQNIFRLCRVGLYIYSSDSTVENNTIEVINVDFKGVTRSVVGKIYPQNSGESDADYLKRTASCGIDAYSLLQAFNVRGCVIESFDYGIRTNWRRRSSAASQMGGPFNIDGCYIEDNREDDIYIGPGYYDAFGSGSSYYYFTHIVNITQCRFFGKEHITLYGAIAYVTGNQSVAIFVNASSSVTTVVEYDGPFTIDGLVGGTATVHKIGGRPQTVRNMSGSATVPGQNFQRMQQTRYYGRITSRMNGYDKASTNANPDNVTFKTWNFETEPKTRFTLDILPLESYCDGDNSYKKLIVPSGNQLMPVTVDGTYNFRALNTFGGISLFEFIRRWKAGTVYTGTVQCLFPYQVTADPVAGTVTNESGTIVGFGKNALGTIITTSYTTGYYLFVDAMVWVRISYSRIKQYCDHLQCGRTYSELRGSINDSSTYSAYLSCYGTNANMANVQKRINAVYWDTTNSKLMIYTGFEWVEMTTPIQRYYYKAYGVKLSERPSMAELPGQTFTNYSTGITYTFIFRANNNYKWVPSIGMVDDLAHPNGYADDNTLDYANELSVGEMVMYNGALYKWDGTQLTAM